MTFDTGRHVFCVICTPSFHEDELVDFGIFSSFLSMQSILVNSVYRITPYGPIIRPQYQ